MGEKRFRLVIEKDEEGEFLGSVSELPGFHVLSWSNDEFMQRVRTAVEGYRQSLRPIPSRERSRAETQPEEDSRKSWVRFEETLKVRGPKSAATTRAASSDVGGKRARRARGRPSTLPGSSRSR